MGLLLRVKKWSAWVFVGMLVLVFSACSATPERRSFGQVIDDAVITSKIKTKMLKDPVAKGFRVDVDTSRGVVSLNGKLKTQEEVERALAIARSQAGVREVKSYLVLKGLPAGEIGSFGERDLTGPKSVPAADHPSAEPETTDETLQSEELDGF